jgi:hypothetical protein
VWEAEIDDDSEDTFSINNHNLISLNRNQNNLIRHGGAQESYEQLIILDDNVVTPIPEKLLKRLPTSKFT